MCLEKSFVENLRFYIGSRDNSGYGLSYGVLQCNVVSH